MVKSGIIPNVAEILTPDMFYDPANAEIYSGILLYRSECINVLGRFNPVKIPLNLFKNNTIKILFIKNTKRIIKELEMNIDDFLRKKKFDIVINNTTLQHFKLNQVVN